MAAAFVLAFAYFVWPTPWAYFEPREGRAVRRNRFTNEIEVRAFEGHRASGEWRGYVESRKPAAAPDDFDTLLGEIRKSPPGAPVADDFDAIEARFGAKAKPKRDIFEVAGRSPAPTDYSDIYAEAARQRGDATDDSDILAIADAPSKPGSSALGALLWAAWAAVVVGTAALWLWIVRRREARVRPPRSSSLAGIR